MVQASSGHNAYNEEISERLLTQYYPHLLEFRDFMNNRFHISVLEHLEEFDVPIDNEYYDFYKQVLLLLNSFDAQTDPGVKITGRYYVNKVKPIKVGGSIFYEITLSKAFDNTSKFDRITVFSKSKLISNYSVQISGKSETVRVFDSTVRITVVTNWGASIRPQELNSFYKIFHGTKSTISSNYTEYRNLMNYITHTGCSITDMIYMDENKLQPLIIGCELHRFYDALMKARDIVNNNLPGSNIVKYIAFVMHNTLINNQIQNVPNPYLSNLFIKNKAIPFDKMPFAMSLHKHVASMENLIMSIGAEGREHELIGRQVSNNSNNNGILYTPLEEIQCDGKIEVLVDRYNDLLWSGHKPASCLTLKNGYIYINGIESNCIKIIEMIKERTKERVIGYEESFRQWLKENAYLYENFDQEKLDILSKMFNNTRVSVITGAAGTGKTSMVKILSDYFSNQSIMFLTVTNAALSNLRRRVGNNRATYMNIFQFVKPENTNRQADILVLDECSTISNEDMVKILKLANYKLLLLVGDEYQIESVNYGNWFRIIKQFIPSNCFHELTHPYRTEDNKLLKLWDDVRKKNQLIATELITFGYTADIMSRDMMEPFDEDEIILCLNYNGVFGINNINRFMQDRNKNKPVNIGLGIYKVDDPVVFNETLRFPELYNNLKGKIIGIEKENDLIWFTISLEEAFTELDFYSSGLEYMGTVEGRTNIRLYVKEYNNEDDDDDDDTYIVPFNVAYAVSIHKSQGLEYNSVKIIIANDVEEGITHNVFYTAITRAKKYLKIYWSDETRERVIENLQQVRKDNDLSILKTIMKNGL